VSRKNTREKKTERRELRCWEHPDQRCWDCNVLTEDEYYMLYDELWDSLGIGRHRILCIGCAEIRLGRRLVPADFTDCPVNRWLPLDRSPRLRDRLGWATLG